MASKEISIRREAPAAPDEKLLFDVVGKARWARLPSLGDFLTLLDNTEKVRPKEVSSDYLRRIGRIPVLTREQEILLAQRIEEGRPAKQMLDRVREGKVITRKRHYRELEEKARSADEAKEIFILSNLKLVVSIAKKHWMDTVEPADLIQEGNIALMKAVDKFNWRRGVKFSTYATWWIKRAIGNARYNKVWIISLDTPLKDHSESTIGEFIPDSAQNPEIQVLNSLTSKEIQKILDGPRFTDIERDVFELRAGLKTDQSLTLQEIGDLFKVTRERIRQIEARALTKLVIALGLELGEKSVFRKPIVQLHAEDALKRFSRNGEDIKELIKRLHAEGSSLYSISKMLKFPIYIFDLMCIELGLKN